MSEGSLVVHGHFYQPPRIDPVTGALPRDPSAAPARDWNSRISAECYRPNAEVGNLRAMSWDLGPTLASWLDGDGGDPIAYRGFVDGDRRGSGLAQPYHHTILPLASAADRRTEIRWGIRDFEVRFGRRPAGMWLPETAVDTATLRLLADHGITHTILAPWQLAGEGLDTRRPARVDLGDGRSMLVACYDGLLSAALSFEPGATIDADAFVRDRIVPRITEPGLPEDVAPLVLLATDGELYGHHQRDRQHFVARLVGTTAPADAPYARPSLAEVLLRAVASGGAPLAHIRERTSWSCHHGVVRWAGDCGCVRDGSWKAVVRIALERLAGGLDAASETAFRSFPGTPDPWAVRDAYVDVLLKVRTEEAFTQDWLGPDSAARERQAFLALVAAQRWRLAMFASCGWFWESPDRPETRWAVRAARRAAELADGTLGTTLAPRLAADLEALAPGSREGARNPSARGLRATG